MKATKAELRKALLLAANRVEAEAKQYEGFNLRAPLNPAASARWNDVSLAVGRLVAEQVRCDLLRCARSLREEAERYGTPRKAARRG